MAIKGKKMANLNGTTLDLRATFLGVYSVLKSELLNDPAFEWSDDSRQWVERVSPLSFLPFFVDHFSPFHIIIIMIYLLSPYLTSHIISCFTHYLYWIIFNVNLPNCQCYNIVYIKIAFFKVTFFRILSCCDGNSEKEVSFSCSSSY